MTTITYEQKLTPMMAQWHNCKKNAKGAILLFRMGDFYEAFYDDAAVLAKELKLTLTKRQNIPMSGVPHHACEGYIDKLVTKGYRVAIAEQIEDPKQAKGLVKRAVTRVVSPGTIVTSNLLVEKRNNFCAALTQVGSLFGLSFLDLTTSEFHTLEVDDLRELLNTFCRLRPAELVISEKFKAKHQNLLDDISLHYKFSLNTQENWIFDHQPAYDLLVDHFKVHNLDGFGLKGMVSAINASGALLYYLRDDLCLSIDHIKQVSIYGSENYMSLDHITLRNLELTEPIHSSGRENTLLGVLDNTHTPMGGRMLHHWVKHPLVSVKKINQRQDSIENFVKEYNLADELSSPFSNIYDLERLMMRITTGYASPRDFVALKQSLVQIPTIKHILRDFKNYNVDQLHDLSDLTEYIDKSIVDNPPLRLHDGNIFRNGFNEELDELQSLRSDGKNWIVKYQERLRQELNIRTLKVGYSRAFGYYIDVSKAQADKMPETFQRRQTLVNNERFISQELKEYETKLLSAEERISAIESKLFLEVRDFVARYDDKVLETAKIIADIDCLLSLAITAKKMNYTRPKVDDSNVLNISGGRHPVIEAAYLAEAFIPNDTILDSEDNRLLVITGPNMAGKSTYIRQVALITIMAHMGSFVPAGGAHIGIVDKVFTRIGASDDLTRGQSTFMVEMAEAANILNNATNRSLVILDEIGRGTSTYDGISIAWAVAEYLLTTPERSPKTLFATHYWELTKLEERLIGAVNYNVAVKEYDDKIIFVRKIIRGDTDKSYGIHVAQLAGLPPEVIERAKEILEHLESNANTKKVFAPANPQKVFAAKTKNSNTEIQLLLFEPKPKPPKNKKQDKILEELKKIDINETTPVQAFNILSTLKNML
jgi:DNA mismatch repair protein MutS